jgi:hypothetical protein
MRPGGVFALALKWLAMARFFPDQRGKPERFAYGFLIVKVPGALRKEKEMLVTVGGPVCDTLW